MRVLIFGVGRAYKNRKYYFDQNTDIEIVGFIDNNQSKQGFLFEGIRVYSPYEIGNLSYDKIILLSNLYYESQKAQMMELGVNEECIWTFYHLKKYGVNHEKFLDNRICSKNDILIITYRFGIDGGSLATVYLAEALQTNDRKVCIATDYITEEARRIVDKHGINLVIFKSLPYMSETFIEYTSKFKYVIVNTVQMLPSATELFERRIPTCVWVHEGEEIWYQAVQRVLEREDVSSKLPIVFVSSVSKALYMKYYLSDNNCIIPVALPDSKTNEVKGNQKRIKVVVIGANTLNKNPILIIDAVKCIQKEYREMIEVDFIGIDENDGIEIRKKAEKDVRVNFHGVVPPEEVHEFLEDADCVVCTSLRECLPTTAVEGFMHGCITVVPDSAGISDYINDRINGYLYRVNDKESLSECLKDIIEKRNHSEEMRLLSRKLYEKFFQYDSLRESFLKFLKENWEDTI